MIGNTNEANNPTLSIDCLPITYLFTDDGSSRVEMSNETGLVLGIVY